MNGQKGLEDVERPQRIEGGDDVINHDEIEGNGRSRVF
jgi:hypothetical protein